ncbi:MAG: PAS domain S-box protein [Ilumatobacteraceae bacterium]
MVITNYVQHDEWYRLVAQNVADMVLLQDAQHRYLWASPSVYDTLGWTPEEVIGRDSSWFISPETQMRLTAARLAAGDGVVDLHEVQVRCADGSWRWVSSRSSVVVLPDMTKGRVSVVRDIDDRVRTTGSAPGN